MTKAPEGALSRFQPKLAASVRIPISISPWKGLVLPDSSHDSAYPELVRDPAEAALANRDLRELSATGQLLNRPAAGDEQPV